MSEQVTKLARRCTGCGGPLQCRETKLGDITIGAVTECSRCGHLQSAWAGNIPEAKRAIGLGADEAVRGSSW